MTRAVSGETARIYQFPVGGRAGLIRRGSDSRRIAEQGAQYAVSLDFDSWYHKEAIEESTRGQEH